MYYKRKKNIIFRDYGSFGYITDNRNFGYKRNNDIGDDIGDMIISNSGADFYSALSDSPLKVEALVEKVIKQYTNVDVDVIKADLIYFYNILVSDGFIASGETPQQCNENDAGFSYRDVKVNNTRKKCKSSINESTQEYFENFFDNEPQLTNLHIEITSKCNERCVHCYIPHENKCNSMSKSMFYNILEQCRELNLLHITISGGEPMEHNDFIEFLGKCNEYNFSVNLLSNLTLMDDSVVEEMKKNRLLSVQVSLYSMDAKIHDTITQVNGSFDKTMRAIIRLMENDIPMQISCPIMKQNKHSYIDVLKWGKEHNVSVGTDYVIIAKYDHTTDNLSNRLSIDDIKDIIISRITTEPQFIKAIESDVDAKKEIMQDDFICSVCHSSLCITDNGNVYPCAGWQDYVVGNINVSTLENIWKKSSKIKFLRNLRKKDFSKCIDCSEKEFCTMCMVRNANEDPLGNPLAVNGYFCDIAKLHKEIYVNYKRNSITCKNKS